MQKLGGTPPRVCRWSRKNKDKNRLAFVPPTLPKEGRMGHPDLFVVGKGDCKGVHARLGQFGKV